MTVAEVPLDASSLIAEVAGANVMPGDGLEFTEALGVLTDALERQARLTPPGRQAVRRGLASALGVQAELAEAIARHPEISTVPLSRPVFITGLLRTGTTLIHNLLAEHPGLCVPALWELMYPVSNGTGATVDGEVLANSAQKYVEEYYRVAPDLPKIHFLDARRPDECHRLTGNAFTTMVYEMRYRVPDYAAWLDEHDHRPAYRFHRAQLQAILWRRSGPGRTAESPGSAETPVVLKDPFHLWRLPALTEVYPEARIVHVHRDPAVTVPSTCSLCAAIRVARSGTVDTDEIGRQWLERVQTALEAVPKVRATALADVPVLDVRYADLVADPLGTLGRICDFAGVPLTVRAEDRMRRYLIDNPADRHGRHRYAAADFGLDETELRRRFADYRDRYGV